MFRELYNLAIAFPSNLIWIIASYNLSRTDTGIESCIMNKSIGVKIGYPPQTAKIQNMADLTIALPYKNKIELEEIYLNILSL